MHRNLSATRYRRTRIYGPLATVRMPLVEQHHLSVFIRYKSVHSLRQRNLYGHWTGSLRATIGLVEEAFRWDLIATHASDRPVDRLTVALRLHVGGHAVALHIFH